MDVFIEHLVKHKPDAKDFVIILAVIFCGVMLSFVALPFFMMPAFRFLVFLLVFAVWYGVYFVIKCRNVEYEYIMTNSSLDIDKIMGKSRRKRVISVDWHEVEICAAVSDSAHKGEYNSVSEITKVLDCTGYKTTDVYFIDIINDKGRTRVLFEPKTKMIENAQKFNPRKIFVKN